MQVVGYNPKDIIIDPANRARKGEPSKAKIKILAENYLNRREEGQEPQIQPGIVRLDDKDRPILVAGEHRVGASLYLNSAMPDLDEPYLFYAITVRATDIQALADAIAENEFRVAPTILDRGEAISKLMVADPKLTQADVAKLFGKSQGAISDALACAKLPKNIQKMITGDDKNPPKLTEEAAAVLARIKDKDQRQEVLDLAVQYQNDLDAIAEHKEAIAKEAEEAGEEDGDAEETEKGKKTGKKGTAPVSDAVKNKAKKKGKGAAKGKVTAETVKAAVKAKGAGKGASDGKRTRVQFLTAMESLFGPNVEEAIPASVRKLCSKIEEYLDGDVGEQGLKNGFMNNCVPD